MAHTDQSEPRRYNRILSEIDGVYHDLAVKQGFSDSAMAILYVLSDQNGRCRLPDLIRLTAISKQTINSALRKLERDGLVCLEPAESKSKRVCLTEKGFLTTHETVDRVLAVEKRIYDSWSAEEWALYLQLTERFLSQLREEMKEFL